MNTTTSTQTTNPMARVMALPNFRLLFIGAFVSLLGDQFALIATPWLVLQLTKDPLQLGFVLALEGLPRAVFILFGGAITDRFSPRRVMLVVNVIRFVLTALMAAAVLTGTVQLWMIYVFSLSFGIVAGFSVPAETSIVPTVVEEAELQAGNSVIMAIAQLANFIGPTVAGIIIGRYADTFSGVGFAYAFDAFTFVVSAVTLQLIRVATTPPISEVNGGSRRGAISEGNVGAPAKENMWASIQTGVKYLWNDHPLRFIMVALSLVNFLLIGPIMVGIPVLASTRLPEGATAFGLLMSAFAGGSLIGYLLAGSLPRPNGGTMRLIMIALFVAFGVVIGALGIISSTWLDFALLFGLGAGNGFIAIILVTWMQTRAPKEMLGRMMALMMLSSTGLMPISQAIAGAISKWNLTMLFVIPGALVLLMTAIMAFHPDLKGFSESLSVTPQAES